MASWTLPGGTRAPAGPYRAERGSLAREAPGDPLGQCINIYIYIYIYISSSDFAGGTFANFGLGGDVCQQMAKYATPINNLYRKHIKGSAFASFRATQCCQTYLGSIIFLHMAF